MPDQGERLRDAFAQLLAQQGPQGAVPAEALWAAQGRQQGLDAVAPSAPAGGADYTGQFGMPMAPTSPPQANFPGAEMGPGLQSLYRPKKQPTPFPDALARQVKPAPRGSDYGLPESPEPKKKKNKKDKT